MLSKFRKIPAVSRVIIVCGVLAFIYFTYNFIYALYNSHEYSEFLAKLAAILKTLNQPNLNKEYQKLLKSGYNMTEYDEYYEFHKEYFDPRKGNYDYRIIVYKNNPDNIHKIMAGNELINTAWGNLYYDYEKFYHKDYKSDENDPDKKPFTHAYTSYFLRASFYGADILFDNDVYNKNSLHLLNELKSIADLFKQ